MKRRLRAFALALISAVALTGCAPAAPVSPTEYIKGSWRCNLENGLPAAELTVGRDSASTYWNQEGERGYFTYSVENGTLVAAGLDGGRVLSVDLPAVIEYDVQSAMKSWYQGSGSIDYKATPKAIGLIVPRLDDGPLLCQRSTPNVIEPDSPEHAVESLAYAMRIAYCDQAFEVASAEVLGATNCRDFGARYLDNDMGGAGTIDWVHMISGDEAHVSYSVTSGRDPAGLGSGVLTVVRKEDGWFVESIG